MKHELEKQKRGNLMLKNFVSNIKTRTSEEYIYIATTKCYASQNNFKIGGCGSKAGLSKRLSTYNTGRPQNDLYYFCKLFCVTNFIKVEDRIKDNLKDFKDTSEKEMYILHYDWICAFLEVITENYNEEITILNDLIKNIIKTLIDKTPVV